MQVLATALELITVGTHHWRSKIFLYRHVVCINRRGTLTPLDMGLEPWLVLPLTLGYLSLVLYGPVVETNNIFTIPTAQWVLNLLLAIIVQNCTRCRSIFRVRSPRHNLKGRPVERHHFWQESTLKQVVFYLIFERRFFRHLWPAAANFRRHFVPDCVCLSHFSFSLFPKISLLFLVESCPFLSRQEYSSNN